MLWVTMAGLAFAGEGTLRDAADVTSNSGQIAPPPEAPRETENVFDVLEYQIEGNNVLPTLAIEQAVYPHLGEKKTIKDVEAARLSLENTYHDAGYLTALVDIPEQDTKTGVIRLKVTEATVERLKVSGAHYFSLGRIKQRVPALAEGGVPYFPDVQTQLADVGHARDRQVTPVLRAGRTPGKVEVELKVTDQLPLHGSFELNNRQSTNTSALRAVASLHYDNLWQRDHSIALQYQTAPEKPSEAQVWSLSYVIPGANNTAYALYAVRSRSNVAAVGAFNALGKGNYYGARWIKPLRSINDYSHNLSLGIDYKDSLDSVIGGADTMNTPITYTPLIAQYTSSLRWSEEALTQFDIAANFNIRGLRNNGREFADKRFAAQANYFYLRGGVQHTQPLPGKFSLFAKFDGQSASGPLISNEEFTAGGAESVRGYLESEALGDNGVHGSLELRSPFFNYGLLEQVQALAFIEGARLTVQEALPTQQSRFLLASAGFGLRFKAFKNLTFTADLARAFKSLTATQSGDYRLHARVVYEF